MNSPRVESGVIFLFREFYLYNGGMMNENYNTPNSGCCGRPFPTAPKNKCNYNDCCINEYAYKQKACIRNKQPDCESQAVIPSITVETVDGISNLANCLIHVMENNTTYYVDDKHRILITWAGPVNIPGYDMEGNPNNYKNQIVTDVEAETAVIYDNHGKGYIFGITPENLQQAVNDKLDEMATDGTLENLIAEYIEDVVFGFDTVADMKASTDLQVGNRVRTLGFHTLNDGGGAYYKIADTGTADEMNVIAVGTGLYANLVLEDAMNVRQFGAKGDGINDDTAAIQTALDGCNDIFVPSGTYMVNAITHINLRSGNKLELDKDAVIKAITNDATSYTILLVEDCEDIEICGGTIEGERLTHTGASGEWGHCIRLWGTSNRIYIHDINLINAWGDGIDCDITGSVVTSRVHVNNARRNGYSITKADSFISNDDMIENTNGTSPQCAVDVEPNENTDILRNIVFNNLRTKNNAAYGIYLALNGGNETSNYTSIEINNLRSDGDNRGIGGTIRHGRLGHVNIINPVILNSSQAGILLTTQSEMPILIDHPIVKYYGASAVANVGIEVNGTLPEGVTSIGNIDIINPIVSNPTIPSGSSVNPTWAITARAPLTNVHIIDPLDLGGRLIRLGMAEGNLIQDTFELCKRDIDANFTISADGMWMYATSSNYTANHFINIRGDQAYPIGTKFNFINTGNYKMEIRFPDNYVYPISSVTGSSVILNDKGASITIKRISNDAWTIIEQNGNITVS